MQANVGGIDRILRILIGVALLIWGFSIPNYLLMIVGLVPLITGFMKWCPAYTLFGIKTCKV